MVRSLMRENRGAKSISPILFLTRRCGGRPIMVSGLNFDIEVLLLTT